MYSSIDTLIKNNRNAFYVFDILQLKTRLQYLRQCMPKNISLCYAVKANTFIVKEIINDVDRFEVCSPGEAAICRELHVPSEKTVISGVYKTPEVMDAMVKDPDFNGLFTVESLEQYDLFCRLSEKYHKKICLLLRLTNDSQFGINESDIIKIVEKNTDLAKIDICGIQFFSGTQKTSVKKLKREIEYLDRFIIRLKEDYNFETRELEYGTGFPAAYFEADSYNEQELLEGFSQFISEMKSTPKITIELGRSIAACCGSYYTHIVDIKHNKSQNYALIDGGMHHLVYYGQHMAMKKPFFNVYGKEQDECIEEWNICGSLCSMNDIITKQVALPQIEISDVFVFKNVGAYCMTECIALFLSRDIPAVYLRLENGQIVQVRKSVETAELNTPKYERNF